MDIFTDTEIFCDVLEAAHKRSVFVFLLLDHNNIKLFTEMCDKVQITEDHLKVLLKSQGSHAHLLPCLPLRCLLSSGSQAFI